MQRDEHSSEFWNFLQHDEAEMPRHDIPSNSCKYHMSFQPSEIPSTSHHGSDFAENSKADLFDENEFCVVDPCHKKSSIICHLLEEETLVQYLLCETHHLSGPLKEDREDFMVAMNNLDDINALVAR